MKIVTDKRGLYAIRWGIWPFDKYFDIQNPGYWWKKSSHFYLHCWSSKDKIEAWFAILNPKVAAIIVMDKDP